MNKKLSQYLQDEFKSESRTNLAPCSPALEPEKFETPRRMFCMLRRKPEKPIKLQNILNNPQANLSSLFQAAREGNEQVIEYFVEKTSNFSCWFNTLDDSGFAPLHHAARYNQVGVVACLLRNGARRDVRGKDDVTPLQVAARYNCIEVVQLLVDEGADVNSPKSCGSTALSLACRRSNTKVIEILLSQDYVCVNAKDYNDDTPLHQACAYGGYEVAQLLLNKGADTEAVNTDARTPLHSAVYLHGCIKTVKLIISKVESQKLDVQEYISRCDAQSNTALHLAAQNGFSETVQFLLEKKAEIHALNTDKRTPLQLACMAGHVATAKILIGQGADVNTVDTGMSTPMHKAACNNHLEIVKLLFKNRGSRNSRDKDNTSPLMCAVSFGHLEIAKFLLESGADVRVRDKNAKSCLHFALESQAFETLEMLLENGGESLLDQGDVNDSMPIHYSAILQDVKGLEILVKYKCLLNPKNSSESTPLHLAVEHNRQQCVQLLCRIAPVQMNDVDGRGRTPLHLAAVNGRRKICQILLRSGSDLSTKDENRMTPVHYAAANGSNKVLEDMLYFNISLDDADNVNNTALHWAVLKAHVQTVKLLLDAGADVMKRNDDGQTCLDIAVDNSDVDVALEIVKHKRGRDILYYRGLDGYKPMKGLIETLPEVAEYVMDQCIERSKLPRHHHDYTVTYDFRLLDPGPDDETSLEGDRFFAPTTMVKCKREKLLCHPLCRKLLKIKWASFGRFLYYLNFLTYLVFLTSFTLFTLILRGETVIAPLEFHVQNNFSGLPPHCRLLFERNISDNSISTPRSNLSSRPTPPNLNITQIREEEAGRREDDTGINVRELFKSNMPLILAIFITAQLVKELIQMICQRFQYFKDPTNLLEWVLYSCSLVFVVPSIYTVIQCIIMLDGFLWIFGTIGVFLAWLNMCLFLRRFGQVGIYVSMLFDVLRTVIKVTLMFTVLLAAFGIVFYLLLKEQKAFQTLELSLLKVIVMTIGEMDYTDTFVTAADEVNPDNGAPKLPLQLLAQIFFLIFCFVMPIIFMNLLVGLAVGDIDTIQKSAHLQKMTMLVDFVSDIEDRYPRVITRFVYKPKLVVKPNQLRNTRLKRLKQRLKPKTYKPYNTDDSDDDGRSDGKTKEAEMMEKFDKDLRKQKLKMKNIHEAVMELQQLVKGVANALDVGTEDVGQSVSQLDMDYNADQNEPISRMRNMLTDLISPHESHA